MNFFKKLFSKKNKGNEIAENAESQPAAQSQSDFGKTVLLKAPDAPGNAFSDTVLLRQVSCSGETVPLGSAFPPQSYGEGTVPGSEAGAGINRAALGGTPQLINPATGEKTAITSAEFKIGSDESLVDFVINSGEISRHHATIYIYRTGGIFIEDNDSTNKTEVEGVEINPFEKFPLQDGALLLFADRLYQFYIEKEEMP